MKERFSTLLEFFPFFSKRHSGHDHFPLESFSVGEIQTREAAARVVVPHILTDSNVAMSVER
jgi:hypothetical protein